MRRLGKTTLFLQVINTLLDRNVEPQSIWYFSFDEDKYDLDELFTVFKIQTRKDYHSDKIFIFFDEIQKLEGFQSQLKIYYDLYPNLKFFISGSTSLYIRKKTLESLAGRVFSFDIANKQVLPVEVNYKTNIRNSDLNNLFLFCKKFHLPKAVILLNTIENQTMEFKGLTIEIKPVFSAMTD